MVRFGTTTSPEDGTDMNPATDLVNKLWRLCAMLRKDGVTYQQYVTEGERTGIEARRCRMSSGLR